MFPDQPLSESEIDELETFLESEAVSDHCMDISMLHGFLTAVAIGPSIVLPSEWLPVVWGEAESPEFESLEKANRILELIMRLQNSIIWTLQDDPEEFEPILLEGKTPEGGVVPIAEGWCEGFMEAVSMRVEDWDPLSMDRERSILLMPILAFRNPETLKGFLGLSEEHKLTPQDIIEMMPDAVAGIYHYWLERRKPSRTGRTLDSVRLGRSPKISRNDPCPCGSGKKYKKCCALRPQ